VNSTNIRVTFAVGKGCGVRSMLPYSGKEPCYSKSVKGNRGKSNFTQFISVFAVNVVGVVILFSMSKDIKYHTHINQFWQHHPIMLVNNNPIHIHRTPIHYIFFITISLWHDWLFIQQSSGGRYKYKKEKCAI